MLEWSIQLLGNLYSRLIINKQSGCASSYLEGTKNVDVGQTGLPELSSIDWYGGTYKSNG